MASSYLLLVSAMSGAAVLALEVLAARVLAPAMGNGVVTWSALLAAALGMLAVGNLCGGMLCERVRPCTVIVGACTVASASLVLLIDGLQQSGLPDQLAPGSALRQGYLLEAALGERPRVARALVIGLGAGLAPRILAMHGIECDTVEIDPQVVEIARTRFAFQGQVTIADGRAYLSQSSQQYDLIFLDVCTAERCAWHLFTVEGMQQLRKHLSPEGIAVMQFIGDDGPWSASVVHTVDTVFGQCRLLAARTDVASVGPRWIFAGRELAADRPIISATPGTDDAWQTVPRKDKGRLLTDDHFPAELDWAVTALVWRSLTQTPSTATR